MVSADIYVYNIQAIINLKIERFIELKFKNQINVNNFEHIDDFFNKLMNETISVAKDKFSHFDLYGHINFSDFITELLADKESITQRSKYEALYLFKKCANEGICGDALKVKFKVLTTKTGIDSKARIINAIRKKYNM